MRNKSVIIEAKDIGLAIELIELGARLQLLEAVGDPAYDGYERTIDQHIKNLRAKLGDDARRPRHILTVYGVGYKFITAEADDA